jgi:glucosamine-6-phosphate deaminase
VRCEDERVPAPCPLVLDDPARVGLLGAELVANRLRARPGLRLLLPTGRTPEGMYAALRDHAADRSLPTEDAAVFQLDEYAGLGPADPRSFAATLRHELGELRFAAMHLLDGAAPDPVAEARRHQMLLDEAPIDLAVLGLGRDGHVAFDEPGTLPEQDARVVGLDPMTIADAAAAFGGEADVPRQAITVGLRTLRDARALLLLVTGETKAPALRALLEDPVSTRRPASLLRDHPRLTIIADRAAAGLLTERRGANSDRALVVLGHREPDGGSEHLASEASFARLHHAAHIAHREPVRLAVMTGWTTTGGLSEAEQMLTAWNEPDTPALLEVAGRNTAENASRSLPLLLASGVIRRVTVVTSAWHLRAPYFFAAYGRYGLDVDSDRARHHGPWLRMLMHELREAPAMVHERREALAAVRLPRETPQDA